MLEERDAVDVMAGMQWELKLPKLIGVKLSGELEGWASAKDVILKLAGLLSVKGGTGSIVEYFGDGAESLSCTGKGTICNMGAEIGATTSIFSYDKKMEEYLNATGRQEVSKSANKIKEFLTIDEEVIENPKDFFDEVIEINLSDLEPLLNGPFSPDISTPISKMAEVAKENDWPLNVDVGLIGSCTNSSYEDISRSASIAKQAIKKGLKTNAEFTITPGSEQVRQTIERDGFIDKFNELGARVFANACGPCIGQWSRKGSEKEEKNTIVHSFNRNFAKRADGNPNTHAFVGSPEIVAAIAIAGRLDFDPVKDTLINENGQEVMLDPPTGIELPSDGFDCEDSGYIEPKRDGSDVIVSVNPKSDRLQLLEPFTPIGREINNARLLIKAHGKCTTDHISMAGPWLRYRGHLDNISNNCLIGAVNSFNMKTNFVKNQLTGEYGGVPDTQRQYKDNNIKTIVVGDHNYGEGSSREHAAMEPRHLGVCAVIVKSFARIHETNLKKQGMLALTFQNESDYDIIQEDDLISFINLDEFSPGKQIIIELTHSDGTRNLINLNHSYNHSQIDWYDEGSALNLIKKENL